MIAVTDSLGTTLNRLRRDRKYTQAQVTELLARLGYEIQPAGISKWEKDLTVPNAGQFLALCKIYGVTDVMGTFTGEGPTAQLNEAGRRLVSDYIRVLVESGLYSRQSRARLRPSRSMTSPPAQVRASSWTARATSS